MSRDPAALRAPGTLGPILTACADGSLPANVAAMRLMMEAASPAEIESHLASARAGMPPPEAARLDAVAALISAHPGAFATVKGVLAQARHDRAPGSCEEALDAWRATFDRLAATAADAASALYGLGAADLLDAATSEVVALIQRLGLAEPGADVVEIGCGSGRFVAALAPLTRSVTGLDLSAGMIAEARRRCAARANVVLLVTEGRNLRALQGDIADTVLAADVFPYLVAAGGDLAAVHVREAARILRPGGALLLLNYSYRGEPDLDRSEVASIASGQGLVVEIDGRRRDLALWDAPAWLLRKPGAAAT